VLYSIGKCYDAQKNYSKARDYFKEALSLDPYFSRAFFKIGRTFLKEEMPKNAIQPLEKAYKLENKNLDFQMSLAEAYFLNENFTKALSLFEKVLANNQSNKQVHLNFITILYEVGNIEQALKHLESILDKFDEIVDLLYIKVAFLYELEHFELAYLALQDALSASFEKHPFLFELLPSIENDAEMLAIIKSFSK
jgi:tetratricopeptide (TPR) repeat protein